jgi:nitrite reductase (NO-forming)
MKKKVSFLFWFAIIVVSLTCTGIGGAFGQDISRDPTDFFPYGGALGRKKPATVPITLYAHERVGTIDSGPDGAIGGGDDVTYNVLTFGHSSDPTTGKIPGPFIRVLEGDLLDITLDNTLGTMSHSIDFHAIKGYRGGGSALMAAAGATANLKVRVMHPGLYVYHCVGDGSIPSIARHISNGMWGMILVAPRKGGGHFKRDLKQADKEFYIMQSEFYLSGFDANNPTAGNPYDWDIPKGLAENPDYVCFNGRAGVARATLAPSNPPVSINVNQFDNVIIYFGNMGPNHISSVHMIGDIWDREYHLGDVLSKPGKNIQTTVVPAAGSAIFAFKPLVTEPVGGFNVLVDHSIFRVAKGALGLMHVLP